MSNPFILVIGERDQVGDYSPSISPLERSKAEVFHHPAGRVDRKQLLDSWLEHLRLAGVLTAPPAVIVMAPEAVPSIGTVCRLDYEGSNP